LKRSNTEESIFSLHVHKIQLYVRASRPFLFARHSICRDCFVCHMKSSGDQGKFVDALLKLSSHSALMYTENHDIPNGIANTTLCHVVKVVLHTGVTENDFTTTNIDGYHVRTIDVTKLDYLLCMVDGSTRWTCEYTG